MAMRSMRRDVVRCPVCGAQPSAAALRLMTEAGGELLVCPRDPWCWCAHPSLSAGVCDLCGLTPAAPRPEVIDAEAPAGRAPAPARPEPYTPRETARVSAPRATRSTCTSCKERIIFATTAGGAEMPVNPDPSDAGNVVIRQDESGAYKARISAPGMSLEPGETRHKPHFATCPHAKKHRKK